MIKQVLYIVLLVCVANATWSQDSTIQKVTTKSKPSVDAAKTNISPRKAAIRSAIIPGWGQVLVRRDLDASFFRKYYSLPIIYGAIGASVGAFAYNLTWYRRTRYAYRVLAGRDTAGFAKVHKKLQYYITTNNASSLQFYRNEFRRDLDYSALFVVLFWGLNVVHASVEAHLKDFDVSPDLGLRFRAGHSDIAGTDGISLILTFK
ncbi:MAG: hypothetical protein JWP69_739 [Flaviaesturariibacter sp.]|nr:hypothetical protein [Flaviaesturariibacter sp.]